MNRPRLLAAGVAILLASLAVFSPTVRAQSSGLSITSLDPEFSDLTAQDLADTLMGGTVTPSNVVYKGARSAVGVFSGGTGIFNENVEQPPLPSGIVISSGAVQSAVGPNQLTSTSSAFCTFVEDECVANAGDSDLDKIVTPQQTYDASSLEFDFVPPLNANVVTFRYVFSSEEYNEFVNEAFNDVFAFYVNGVNYTLLPNAITPVSINNVNGGNPIGTNPHNPQFFRNNEGDIFEDLVSNAPVNIEADGLTVVLTFRAPVLPNQTNHIKLAIADTFDQLYDSWAFLGPASFDQSAEICNGDDDDADGFIDEGCAQESEVETVTAAGETHHFEFNNLGDTGTLTLELTENTTLRTHRLKVIATLVDPRDMLAPLSNPKVFPLGTTCLPTNTATPGSQRPCILYTVVDADTGLPPVAGVDYESQPGAIRWLIDQPVTKPVAGLVGMGHFRSDSVESPVDLVDENIITIFDAGLGESDNYSSVILTVTPANAPPTLQLPAPLVAEATSSAGATVHYTAKAYGTFTSGVPLEEPVYREIPIACTVNGNPVSSPAFFPLDQITQVLCSATDQNNVTATGVFSVQVKDTTGPTIAHDDITVFSTQPAGAIVNFTVTAHDIVDGDFLVTQSETSGCEPESGATFPYGTTTVNCTARDSHNNFGTGSFTVTVINGEATEICGNGIDDDFDGLVDEGCTQETAAQNVTAPGETHHFEFTNLGDTGTLVLELTENTTLRPHRLKVIATLVDPADMVAPLANPQVFPAGTNCLPTNTTTFGSEKPCIFYSVVDADTGLPPVEGLDYDAAPGAIHWSIDQPVTKPVPGYVGMGHFRSDIVQAPIDLVDENIITLFDAGLGESDNYSGVILTVSPANSAPTMTLPGHLVVEATSGAGASVSFVAKAYGRFAANGPLEEPVYKEIAFPCFVDVYPTPIPVSSGSTFPLGDTTVTCSGTDGTEQTVTGSFVVSVVDTTAPTLEMGSFGYPTNLPGGVAIMYNVLAHDAVDGTFIAVFYCSPAWGSVFPYGTTTVNCSVPDSHGNTATGSFTITVFHYESPEICGNGLDDDLDGFIDEGCTQESAAQDVTAPNETHHFEFTGLGGTGTVVLELTETTTLRPHRLKILATPYVPGELTAALNNPSVFPLGTTCLPANTQSAETFKPCIFFSVVDADTGLAPVAGLDYLQAPGAIHWLVDIPVTKPINGNVGMAHFRSDSVQGPIDLVDENIITIFDAGLGESDNYSGVVLTVTPANAPPTLTLSGHIIAQATSAAGANVTFVAIAYGTFSSGIPLEEPVFKQIPIVCTVGLLPVTSPSVFPLGDTLVNCSATGSNNQTTTGSFLVSVVDTTPPSIAHDDITVYSGRPEGAQVTFSVTAHDAVDGDFLATSGCTPASGSTFPYGDTLVSCSAADTHGNSGNGSFHVNVIHTEAVEECGNGIDDDLDGLVDEGCEQQSAPQTVNEPNETHHFEFTGLGDTGTLVLELVERTTLRPHRLKVIATLVNPADLIIPLANPAVFPAGTGCLPTNTVGNDSDRPCIFYSVVDADTGLPPVAGLDYLPGPGAIQWVIDQPVTKPIPGNVGMGHFRSDSIQTPVDLVDENIITLFDAGLGESDNYSGVVLTISPPTSPPTLTLSGHIIAEATSAAGANVTFIAKAYGTFVSGLPLEEPVFKQIPITCTANSIPVTSPALFPFGDTTVNCSATGGNGLTTTGSFLVTVVDTTGPTIAHADIVVDATSASGAVVTYTVTAHDAVDGDFLVTGNCAPASGSTFAIGDTTVSCSATDSHGNAGTGAFKVTVDEQDTVELNGRMFGVGRVDAGKQHHHYVFRVSQLQTREYAKLEYWVHDSLKCKSHSDDNYNDHDYDGDHNWNYGRPHCNSINRFESTAITSVVFSDDPAFKPSRWPSWKSWKAPTADSVRFTGTGRWNGHSGYTFEAFATDQGEGGRHDTFSLVVRNSAGQVVANVNGALTAGNNQSMRLFSFWWWWR